MGITSSRDQHFRINFFVLRFHFRWRDSYAIIDHAACVLILAEDGPLRLRDGVKEKTRVAGPSGVSLLTDKKVTKVSDESFGFALGEGRKDRMAT